MKKTTIVPGDHISWLIPEIWWDELCASQTVLSNVYCGMQKRKGDGEFVLVESFQTRSLRIWEGNFFRPVVDGLPAGKPVSSDLVVILAGGVEPLELPEQMLTLNNRPPVSIKISWPGLIVAHVVTKVLGLGPVDIGCLGGQSWK